MFIFGELYLCLWYFFPMHFLGMAGLPRRYYDNSAYPMFEELISINEVVSFFAIAGALIQIIFSLISSIVCIEGLNPSKSLEV